MSETSMIPGDFVRDLGESAKIAGNAGLCFRCKAEVLKLKENA